MRKFKKVKLVDSISELESLLNSQLSVVKGGGDPGDCTVCDTCEKCETCKRKN